MSINTCEALNEGPNGKCGLKYFFDCFMGVLCLTCLGLVQLGADLKREPRKEKGEKEVCEYERLGE